MKTLLKRSLCLLLMLSMLLGVMPAAFAADGLEEDKADTRAGATYALGDSISLAAVKEYVPGSVTLTPIKDLNQYTGSNLNKYSTPGKYVLYFEVGTALTPHIAMPVIAGTNSGGLPFIKVGSQSSGAQIF